MSDNTQDQGRVIMGIFIGIIVAFFSCVIVIGGFLLALSEGGVKLSLPASTSLPTTTPLSSSTSAPTLTTHPTETTLPTETTAAASPTPTLTSSPTAAFTSTAPPTLPPTDTQAAPPSPTLAPPTNPPQPPPGCGPPASWVTYIVKAGDTLYSIGTAYGVTVDQLKYANCLTSSNIYTGQSLWVPNVAPQLPTPTNTIIPAITNTPSIPTTALPTNTLPPPTVPPQPTPNSGCGPSPTWVIYIVQAGDTIYSISQAYSITVEQLKYANCLTSNAISPGQSLWVPNITPNFPNPNDAVEPLASNTPQPTTEPPTNTPPPVPTNTPAVPTATSLPPTNSGAPAATKRVEPTLIASVTVAPPTTQPPP